MNKSLDKLMKNNIPETFDNALPPTGHFERFEKRLEQRGKKNNTERWKWITLLSSAAAIATLLIIFQYTRPEDPRNLNSDAVTEVANFYKIQLTEEIEKIEKELNGMEEANRLELEQDMNTMKNESQEFNSRQEAMTEEEHIALIILRYNMQLESLRHIQSILGKTDYKRNEYKI